MSAIRQWMVIVTDEAEASYNELYDWQKTVIQTWRSIIETYGPNILQVRPYRKGFDDHELKRGWAGHRASAFSEAGRIVYCINEDAMQVIVKRIDPYHKY